MISLFLCHKEKYDFAYNRLNLIYSFYFKKRKIFKKTADLKMTLISNVS